VDVISFARGNPSPEILPVEELAECARLAVERDGPTILNYGSTMGYTPLREWIAGRHGVDASRVVITPSSLLGFSFVMRHLFRPGARAVVEAPSYDRTILLLQQLGASVEGVPMDDDGLELAQLESLLDEGEAPIALYTIPTFQNPSGRTLSLSRRQELVELARERDLLIFEDDPYSLVRFEGDPLPSLFSLAQGRGVIYASSFSKTVAPGLRVGYVILPEEMVKPVEKLANSTYISPPLLTQATIHQLISRGGFEPNVARACELLRVRRDAMLQALEAELPAGASWSRPGGGYFLWLDLPAGVRSDELLARGDEAGVAFVKGADFFADGSGAESARLAFSFPSVEEIHEGIRRLAALVREAAAVTA
jgi:2-aminoadipate transaminase